MRLLPTDRKRHSSPRRWPALLALALGLGLCASAASAAEPPGRVARLSHLEGDAGYAPAGGTEWLRAEFNRPLTTGDQFSAAPGARAELHSGSTAIRLQGAARLGIDALDDRTTRLQLTEGALALRIRAIYPGERYEVGTPNLAFVAAQPGDYRFDVDPASGTTRVALLEGTGTVYGDGGQAQPLGAGQQVVYGTRGLAVQQRGPVARDGFDQWADARDRAEAQSASARYVSPETIGYQQLDAYGDWSSDPTYGNVWFPRVTVADWAPYRYGQWRWIAPWGWTWVDDAPWGFAPFHYGRWTQVGSRWGWVPGPRAARATYAPALVGFIGNVAPAPRRDFHGAGRPAERWYPLAPGEAWRPGWRASNQYLENVNRWNGPRPAPQAQPRFAREPRAISAWREDRGARPVNWQQPPERRGFFDSQRGRDHEDEQRRDRQRIEQQQRWNQQQQQQDDRQRRDRDNDRRAQEWRMQRDQQAQQERMQADRAIRDRQFAEQADRQRRAQDEQQRRMQDDQRRQFEMQREQRRAQGERFEHDRQRQGDEQQRQFREQQRQQGEQERQIREQQRQHGEQQRQQREQQRQQFEQQRQQRDQQERQQRDQMRAQQDQMRAQQEQQRAQQQAQREQFRAQQEQQRGQQRQQQQQQQEQQRQQRPHRVGPEERGS